jgi:transposase-like protein
MVAPYAGTKPIPAEQAGTAIFIPVTNAIERLHEEFKRRIKTQTVLPSAETAAMFVLGAARRRSDHHAKSRRMADADTQARRRAD